MIAIDLGAWLIQAHQRLMAVSDTPRLDAQRLLAHITGSSPAILLAHPERQFTLEEFTEAEHGLALLEGGTPLAYVLGEWEFYGLKFTITPDVLIPRPETELLLQTALDWLKEHPSATKVADIGCGSGCIGISLAVHASCISVQSVDVSTEALDVTQRNAIRHDVAHRVVTKHQDLLCGDAQTYDIICANLPYIPTSDLNHLKVARHEPLLALDGGEDGMMFIRRLVDQLGSHLSTPGLALFEIEYRQADTSLIIAREALPNASIKVINDLAGLPRVLVIEQKGNHHAN